VGKFSFFIALFAIVLLAIYFAVYHLFSGSPVQGVLAPLLQLSQASLLVGLLLGIAGLFQSGQSKRLAVLGVLMNGAIVCAQVLLFAAVFYPEVFAPGRATSGNRLAARGLLGKPAAEAA
jgi:hypothetical protein